ncbi:suppressor of fused domain protein [Pseudoneobacillus sp. C159]
MSNKHDQEVSKSGAPIYRHEDKEFELQIPQEMDMSAKEKFEDHIETYIGPINGVYHEILSHLVHIDVYHIAPSKEQPYHTLITHGMSDLPMNVPPGREDYRFAELVCFLPKEFDLSDEGLKSPKNAWALENLKFLARFPHEYNTWLGMGHTLQNGNPIEPFIQGTKLCASLIIPPVILSENFTSVRITADKNIHIYNVFPIYLEEMEFKMKKGIDALLDKFDKNKLNDIYDLNRVNTCKNKWFKLFS